MMRKPLTRAERWMYVVALVLIFGFFSLEVALDYAPAKLSALFIMLAWFPLLAIHELGHALAARLVGGRVDAVVIGFGRTLWLGTLWGMTIEVRTLPIEGFTRTRGTDGRLAGAFVYAAGPGAELLIAGVVLAILGPATLFARTDVIGVIAMQSLALCAVVSAVLNLFPAEARVEQGGHRERRVANDGLGIVRSLLGRH